MGVCISIGNLYTGLSFYTNLSTTRLIFSEKEKQVLKEKLDSTDSEIEDARSRLLELERDRQRLEGLERRLETANSHVADAQLEQKQLVQQLEMESKRTTK